MAYLYNHAHPCLPVTFLPSDPSVVVWAERGGRVHAYDLRRARARRAPRARARGEPLEAVDMSPPKPPRGAGAIGGLNAHAAMGPFAMLHPDEDEDEDAERADALTATIVASMDPETRARASRRRSARAPFWRVGCNTGPPMRWTRRL